MSCLLDKLAPETRTIIYEYVLSFDTPLKHVTKMQPFVKKLTGVEPKSGSGSTGSMTESMTDLKRVNTSILTASKLIYVEAVAVFYKHNTIHFDPQLGTFGSLVSPGATDLSLARNVVVKLDEALDPEMDVRFGEAMDLSITTIPAIFPKLRTCSVYVDTDTEIMPLTSLIVMYYNLRRSDLCNDVRFDSVGSFHACFTSRPWSKLIMQSRRTIDCWTKTAEIPAATLNFREVSASSLYKGSRADSQNIYGKAARDLFNLYKRLVKLPELEGVMQDGYEYWTSVEACLDFLKNADA